MNYSEEVAKRVLETIFPGATMEYRQAQSNREYDFILKHSDGSTAAVEVTSSVDRDSVQTNAAIRSERRGGSIIEASACRKSWVVYPLQDASINRIRQDVDTLLARLEQDGVDGFSHADPSPLIRDLCCRLQITAGFVLPVNERPTNERPTIKIRNPVGGSAVGADTATKAAETEAFKQDNRLKLGAAQLAERHLVVYIDAGHAKPWIAINSFDPPASLPNIPQEITDLWLIGQSENAVDEFIVWRASSQVSWHSARVVVATTT